MKRKDTPSKKDENTFLFSSTENRQMFVYLARDVYSWQDKHLKSSKFDFYSTAKPSFEWCQQFKRLVELFAARKKKKVKQESHKGLISGRISPNVRLPHFLNLFLSRNWIAFVPNLGTVFLPLFFPIPTLVACQCVISGSPSSVTL